MPFFPVSMIKFMCVLSQIEGEKISFGGGWLKTVVLLGESTFTVRNSDVLDGW